MLRASLATPSKSTMDFSKPASEESSSTDAIIVKADEVDEAGADISTIDPTNTSSEYDFNERIESRRAQDAQPVNSPKILANTISSPSRPPSRPILRREGSAPAPPQQPPPAPPRQQQSEEGHSTESLSLLQLRKIVGDLPKPEPKAYAYEYEETRSFPEELQEWFQYTEGDRYMLVRAREVFEEICEFNDVEKSNEKLNENSDTSSSSLWWTGTTPQGQKRVVEEASEELDSDDLSVRVKSLGRLVYIALGAWVETAGLEQETDQHEPVRSTAQWLEAQSPKSVHQMSWIINGVKLLCSSDLVQKLIRALNQTWQSEQSVSHCSHP